MAQVIDQYAIRIGFQLNSAQMASVQRMVHGFVGGLNGRVIPSLGRAVNQIQSTTRQSLAVLDAAVARTSKLGADLSVRLSLPLAALAGYGIRSAAEIEKSKLTLEAMVGDADKTKKVYSDLSKYAITSAYNIQGLTESANKMLAVGTTTPEGIQGMIELIGALAMGDNEKFKSIAFTLGQITTAGRIMGNDPKQLSDALVNLYPVLEKMRGMEKGSINSGNIARLNVTKDEVIEAMRILAKTGPYLKIMEKLKGSLFVALSGIAERFYLFAGAVGESLRQSIGLDKVLEKMANLLTAIEKRIDRMTDGQKKLLVSVGLFLIAVGPLTYFLSVWMRTGAAMLRITGSMTKAFMGLKAVGKGGGLVGMVVGSAGGKAFLIVAGVVAIVAGILAIIDDFIVWKDGGKSLLGFLIGEKEKWEWVRPILKAMKEMLQIAEKLAAYGVLSVNKAVKAVLPSAQEVRESGGLIPHMLKGARDMIVPPQLYSKQTWSGISRMLPFAPPQQKIRLSVPFAALSPKARDEMTRLGFLTAPQNNYVREFDLIQADSMAGRY